MWPHHLPSCPIADSWIKLIRSKHHADAFYRGVELFDLEGNDGRVLDEQDPDDNRAQLFWFKTLRPPPKIWASMVGDSIHNLRSALDHLAWQLASEDRRSKRTSFPIFDHRKGPNGYDAKSPKMLAGMPDEAKTLIESLQPFQAGGKEAARATALSRLGRLDNFDKHCELAVAQQRYLQSSSTPTTKGIDAIEVTNFREPPRTDPEKGALIARAVILATSSPQSDVKMHTDVKSVLVFGPGVPYEGDPIASTLTDLGQRVEGIVDEFDGRFFEHTDAQPFGEGVL
jgi:hypothetical protein